MRSSIIISTILLSILVNTESCGMGDTLMLRIVSLERKIMEADGDTARISKLLIEKARAYKMAGRFSDALFTLERIHHGSLPDTLRCEIHYEKAFHSFIVRSYSISLQEIWNAQSCGFTKSEHAMLFLMILLENERWDDFRMEYLTQAKHRSFADTVAFSREFDNPELLDVSYFVKKASIPGVGLIKSGYISKGATNIMLQMIFAGFAAYNIYTGYYFTAFFSGIQPMRRFYSGGKILTASLVQDKNHDKVRALKQKGYSYVGKLYAEQ
jgi:hypothetical protein